MSDASGPDSFAAFRHPGVARFAVGRLLSAMATTSVSVAIGWQLYETTGSTFALGLVGLTQMAPMVLFTLPAGHVADNHDRKRIIVLMSAAMVCASLGLTLISAFQAVY